MKKIQLNKRFHFSWKIKLFAVASVLIIIVGFTWSVLMRLFAWNDSHVVIKQQVLSIKLQAPIRIEERRVETKEIIKVIQEIPNPVDLETDVEKYIYEVFGIENYKLAIAVAKAESGLREDAININTNNTVDVGIFQINSIHFKKEGCSLKEVATIKGNVDCAYQIYQSSGWSPWVAYKTGSFINKLD